MKQSILAARSHRKQSQEREAGPSATVRAPQGHTCSEKLPGSTAIWDKDTTHCTDIVLESSWDPGSNICSKASTFHTQDGDVVWEHLAKRILEPGSLPGTELTSKGHQWHFSPSPAASCLDRHHLCHKGSHSF